GCSKLEFSYINGGLVIENGSIIRFKYNDANIFYGYVFKREENKKGEVSVTAYDQLRYCKAKDTIVVKNDTVDSLVKKMCNYFNLKTGVLTNTGYKLPV
ncbi:XkdQ/YqbQ family protein, partial [Rhodanobacter thiooxydans]|uniref:XkdQ/YqbQ family protein n=1 Tax=Rhodanobacter thiooxydans TaxID=416169 RepID=UPI001EE645DB